MRAHRYLESAVTEGLKRKMVFVGGPRQVGKTTFALGFLGKDADEAHPAYLNWDHPGVRPRLRRAELPPGEPLLLLEKASTGLFRPVSSKPSSTIGKQGQVG